MGNDPAVGFSDSELLRMHAAARASGHFRPQELDVPLPSIDYERNTSRLVGRTNGVEESYELFRALTEVAGLPSVYRRFERENLPWVPDASDTAAGSVLSVIDGFREDWQKAYRSDGTSRRTLAEKIHHWLTDPNGFGMVHDETAPEQGFNGLVRNRRGACTEYAFLLLAFYQRAGIPARPMWVGVDMDGHSNIHVCVQIEVRGEQILVDPIFERFGAPHRAVAPMSYRELLAWHENNRGRDAAETEPLRALAHLDRALLIDPFNPHIRVNRALLLDRLGRRQEAQSEIEAALRLAPSFSPAHLALGNRAYDDGRWDDATVEYRSAIASNTENWNARENLIRALVQTGDRAGAERELAHLSALFPAYPELNDLKLLIEL